jgi:YVTN family beta-propeller protein
MNLTRSNTNWVRRSAGLGWLLVLPLVAMAAEVRIVQTNSAGDNVHLIDPSTNKVVGIINGIEVNHGATYAPDGSRYYISDEPRETLDVVDAKTLKIIKEIKLSGHPNNIDRSKDGKRVYVAIIQAPGAIDVIDTVSLERVKTIKTKGGVHNTYVTPDGKYVVGGSLNGTLTVIDQATETIAWELKMGKGIRPMAFTTKPDGSTDKILMNLSTVHGFAVVDFDQRKEVRRVSPPDPKFGTVALIGGTPSHGLAVAPDGKSVWCASEVTESVWGFSLPDFKLIGGVRTGILPNWLTFAPNGMLYVANTGSETTTAVDIKALKVVATIPVGSSPKRVITAVFP